MPSVFIDSALDPRLEAYRDVARPRQLAARGVFVAESRLVIERLLAAGQHAIESLLVSDAAHRALTPHLAAAAPELTVYVAAPSVFRELTGHDFHRGCLAIVKRPEPAISFDIIRRARTLIVLEGVADPDNVGAVFRSALAFGVDAVLLGPGTADPLYRKAIRTSMAATLRVPFAQLAAEWPRAIGRLRESGFELVALTPREPAVEIEEYAALHRQRPLALLVGSEGAGLSDPLLELADYRVRIAIHSEVDSLNLAVATGIALQRLSAPRRPR